MYQHERLFCLIVLILICFTGCGIDVPVVIVENASWPDGTVVSVLQDGRVVDHSTLYGDYVRLRAEQPGFCRIRAGGSTALTWLSEEVTLSDGENHISLPSPSVRRRTGRGMFGLSIGSQGADMAHNLLFENPVPGVTTLTITYDAFDDFENLRALVAVSHANAVENIVSVQVGEVPGDRKSSRQFIDMLDSLEMAGVDGVLLRPAEDIFSTETFSRFVRTAASEIHQRGMTLSVMVPESWEGASGPEVFYREVPEPETPDMIRIAAPVPSESNPSPDVVLLIERAADKLVRDGVPPERISSELAMSAAAFSPRQGGEYEYAPLAPGSLESIVSAAGMNAVLRLRDGTLRLGFRGLMYSFEDVEGLVGKLTRLRNSPLAPDGGIHITYDGGGVRLDRAGLKQLADTYGIQ